MLFHLGLHSYSTVSAFTIDGCMRSRFSISINSTGDEIPTLFAQVQHTIFVGGIYSSSDTELTICLDTRHQASSTTCPVALPTSRISLGPRR